MLFNIIVGLGAIAGIVTATISVINFIKKRKK